MDTRRESLQRLGLSGFGPGNSVVLTTFALLVGAATAYLPEYTGLSDAGRVTLHILVSATLLWVTEAMPPFAVGVLIIATEIALLGRPGGVFAQTSDDWQQFVAPWGSPVIWLFLGGLVLASAGTKTALDQSVAAAVIRRVGHGPRSILLACMALSFVFSMFISNTASSAMMLAVVGPVLRSLPNDAKFGKTLCLAIPLSASIGGMGTPVGSPPNAVVLGLLGERAPSFGIWMLAGVPPALLSLSVGAWWLTRGLHTSQFKLLLKPSAPPASAEAKRERVIVMGVFATTVLLWLTAGLHGVPVAVVSFLPLAVLTTTRVIEAEDIRALPWDILLLLAGGMSLGVAVRATGLANWLVDGVALADTSAILLALAIGALTCLLSNFMSNTAATNVLGPVALALTTSSAQPTLVGIALCASLAVALPASTPPNAIAYSTGRLKASDFLATGILVAVVGVPIAVLWSTWVLNVW